MTIRRLLDHENTVVASQLHTILHTSSGYKSVSILSLLRHLK